MSVTATIIGYKQLSAYDGQRKAIAYKIDKSFAELKSGDSTIYINNSPITVEGVVTVVAYVTENSKTTIFDTYGTTPIDYYGVTVSGDNTHYTWSPYTGGLFGVNIEYSDVGKWGAYNYLFGYYTTDGVFIPQLYAGDNHLSDYFEFKGIVTFNKNLFLRIKRTLPESGMYDFLGTADLDRLVGIGEQILGGHYDEEPDPYVAGGYSGSSGTNYGTFDFTSDTIGVPDLPTSTATNCGFINAYIPSSLQLNTFNTLLWNYVPIDNIKKMFSDPMDMVLGLQIIPSVEDIPSANAPAYLGNIRLSELTLPKATTQYIACDMGTIDIDRKLGSYLDFSPYTKLQLYLPYCTTCDIDPAEVVGGALRVEYHIDIVTGNCIAFVICSRNGVTNVLYQFEGNCASQLPVTSRQYSGLLSGASSLISAGLTSVSGNPIGLISAVGNTIEGGVAMNTPTVQRNGSFNGSASIMAIQSPYLILTIPKICIPESQNAFIGYPSYVTKQLSTLKGFNKIEEIHLSDFTATQTECEMIESLLKEGVIF